MKLQKFPILAAAILGAWLGVPADLWAHHGGGGGHGGGGRGGGFHRAGFNRVVVFGGGGSPYFYGGYPMGYGGYAAPSYPSYNPYPNAGAYGLPPSPVGENANACPVPVAGDVVGNVQRALRYKGFYRGAVDGVTNPTTRAAIRAYDASVGLPATGAIDARLLSSLGIM